MASFDPEAATAAYLKAHDAECRVLDCVPAHGPWPELVLPAVTLAALLLFVASGLSARCGRALARITSRNWLQGALFGPLLVALLALVRAPAAYWTSHVLGLHRGIDIVVRDGAGKVIGATHETSPWIAGALEETAWWMLAAAVAVPVALAILRRFPRSYWLLPAAAGTIWLAINIAESPFDRLSALPAGPLRADLAAIAANSHVPFNRLRLGEQSSPGGGFTEARAVWRHGQQYAVLGERLYNILPVEPGGISPPYRAVGAGEVRAIAGHELAHIQAGHLYWLTAVLVGAVVLVAWLAWWSSGRLLALAGRRWGLASIADPAAFPLVVSCFFLAAWLFIPIKNPIILASEIQADRIGLDLSRDPDGFAALAMREARGGPIRRTFLEQLLLIDHPSDEARIRRAMVWKAQNAPARWQAIGPSGPVRVRR